MTIRISILTACACQTGYIGDQADNFFGNDVLRSSGGAGEGGGCCPRVEAPLDWGRSIWASNANGSWLEVAVVYCCNE